MLAIYYLLSVCIAAHYNLVLILLYFGSSYSPFSIPFTFYFTFLPFPSFPFHIPLLIFFLYLRVELKELQLSYGLNRVFDQIPHLKHGNDGLIFTPVKPPYVCGTCENILKWKPSNKNTV